jgi:hypothetical protein
MTPAEFNPPIRPAFPTNEHEEEKIVDINDDEGITPIGDEGYLPEEENIPPVVSIIRAPQRNALKKIEDRLKITRTCKL